MIHQAQFKMLVQPLATPKAILVQEWTGSLHQMESGLVRYNLSERKKVVILER